MPKMTVRAFNKTLRGLQLLGESETTASGQYSIGYNIPDTISLAVVVQLFDSHNALMSASDTRFDAPDNLVINIDLSGRSYAGPSEYEKGFTAISIAAGQTSLSHLTETDKNPDITFISKKTGVASDKVEKMVMAARFETFSSQPAEIWYGILRSNLPSFRLRTLADHGTKINFETRLDSSFDALMHTAADTLITGLQQSIDQNIVACALTEDLDRIREELRIQIWNYAKKHPVTGQPSGLLQKAQMGGLKGKELQAFVDSHINHEHATGSFWEHAKKGPGARTKKSIDQVEAVFHLSRLTGNNLALTEKLMKSQNIKSTADLKKLAAFSRADWEALLKGSTKGKETKSVKASKNQKQGPRLKWASVNAVQLEHAFASEFPTAAFAARLQKDKGSKLPNRDKVSKFLQQHDQFDLLNTRIGQFLAGNKKAIANDDAAGIAGQLRGVQRIFKLAPRYDHASLLLNDNIHSARQIVKMGRENFVMTYGRSMGAPEAEQIFQKASAVQATAVALVGNLKSMADASAMNAFPDFTQVINKALVQELPNLETLFGQTNFCACDECNSVYGAPAYLTDILHFLENRNSTLALTSKPNRTRASVKDVLLQRRPDIGDIDLNCDNANTELPYIDIACEIMEDYIASPAVTITDSTTTLKLLARGTINPALLNTLIQQFTKAGQTNISQLLTTNATVSDIYASGKLKQDNTYSTESHWMIRDLLVTLKATDLGSAGIEFRLLHQTLQSSEAVSTGPEYVNINAYNILKQARRPFTLPFDLFGTAAELYLGKAGLKRADLIDLFRTADGLPAGQSPTDLAVAYATLGISETEQALIFHADPNNQASYWGAGMVPAKRIETTISVNNFEMLTGLDYSQVAKLLELNFINPDRGMRIIRKGITCDTTMMSISNLGAVGFDAIHRYLRLWRKTSFTMDELDAIIMSPVIGNGKIENNLAWHLQQIISLQEALSLDVFQILGLYGNLDPVYNYPDSRYNQLFQNSRLINPINPDFSYKSVTAKPPLAINDTHKAVIAAVLQITIEDVNILLKETAQLTLAGISLCYRHALLSGSLQLSISDLLVLMKLVDVDPFRDPASTLLFIEKYQTLKFSGFSIGELSYLLMDEDDIDQSLIPTSDRIAAALGSLQDDLLAVHNNTNPAPDQNGTLLTRWLSDPVFNWESGLLIKLMDILNTTDDDQYNAKIDAGSNFLVNLRIRYHDVFLITNLSSLPLTSSSVPISFPADIAAQLSYDG
ncbi:MAG: Tc toxin subunit A, partial [Bacteroidota bacterium]|nr:Tc toxin subunit A [Bacteroidota bacterium]